MKRIAIALVSVLLLAAVLLPRAEPVMGWGLSFPNEGQPPAAPVTPQKLRELGGAYWDEDGGKALYLTFDAGYENGYTGEILDILKELEIPAAFFVTGDYLSRNADLIRRMAREGHIVGNHTMHHPDMTKVDGEAFRAELQGVEEKYFDITGQTLPKYYRPPQGVYDEASLKRAQELGYQTVFWSLAYADWDNGKQPDCEYAKNKILSAAHNGEIMLLHPNSATNAAILDEVITELKALGYGFGCLTDICR